MSMAPFFYRPTGNRVIVYTDTIDLDDGPDEQRELYCKRGS